MDSESLAHTTWNCKYHIVFAPKYRRQIIYGKIKKDIVNLKGLTGFEISLPDSIAIYIGLSSKFMLY